MTPDQMKAALMAALAFLCAAWTALAVILFTSNQATQTLDANRLSLARNGIIRYAEANGWRATKSMLEQQAAWSDVERPHVWLLENGSNRLIDSEAAFPVRLALRALTKPDSSIAIKEISGHARLRVTEAAYDGNRILIGLTAAPANQASAEVISAVLLSSLAGTLGAFAAVFWASRRSNRRIRAIRGALSAFLAGDTTKRVVFSGPVDDLYELAHRVNRTLDQSETQVQNLTHLSSDIAHNLKKPLTRLRRQLEAASDAEDMAPSYRDQAESAVQDLDGIIKIFEALLNISKFQAGSGRSRFVDVDLRKLTAHIVETYESITEDSGKTLQASLPDRVPYIRGHAGLLTELVVNIIENAIQHCPPGTTISVTLAASRDEVSVIVSDNGPGVPTEAVEAVFERFKRLDTSNPGHGIGLPFAVAVAELHNATVELTDNNPGLRVTISFPIDFSKLTNELGLRMRSGLQLKLQSSQSQGSFGTEPQILQKL